MNPAQAIRLRAVSPDESDLFASAMALYQAAIDPAEQRSVARLAEDLRAGREALWVDGDGPADVRAFAVVARLADGSALLDYMAVAAACRGLGLGGRFLARLCEHLRHAGAPRLLIEVDDPAFAVDAATCERRAAFYARQGARPLAGVRHLLPSMVGEAPVVMHLFVLPLAPGAEAVPRATLAGMWRFIYQDLYDRPTPDPLLDQVLDGLAAFVSPID